MDGFYGETQSELEETSIEHNTIVMSLQEFSLPCGLFLVFLMTIVKDSCWSFSSI